MNLWLYILYSSLVWIYVCFMNSTGKVLENVVIIICSQKNTLMGFKSFIHNKKIVSIVIEPKGKHIFYIILWKSYSLNYALPLLFEWWNSGVFVGMLF